MVSCFLGLILGDEVENRFKDSLFGEQEVEHKSTTFDILLD